MRALWRVLGGLWSVLMMLVMAASLALTVAMAVVPAVAAAVAGVIEAVSDVTTIRKREAARVAELEARAARAEGRAAAAAADLDTERAARRAATAELAEVRAARQVTYRGAKVTAGEAVADTSDRLARRVATASARNVGSTFAEALPVVGIGVIAAATAWELHDACELLRDVREMDVALNPDRAVPPEAAQVCGLQAPTRDDIWASITASPGLAWEGAQSLYIGLPDLSLGRFFEASLGMFRATYDWAFGAPLGPVTTEGAAPDRPMGWSPLGWLNAG